MSNVLRVDVLNRVRDVRDDRSRNIFRLGCEASLLEVRKEVFTVDKRKDEGVKVSKIVILVEESDVGVFSNDLTGANFRLNHFDGGRLRDSLDGNSLLRNLVHSDLDLAISTFREVIILDNVSHVESSFCRCWR